MPALRTDLLHAPEPARLEPVERMTHPPRILLLYGSLRDRSYSRLLVEEADRLLRFMGAETRIFDPRDLPMVDSVTKDHPKVQELRALSLWSEGQVWCSPERHGAVTAVFKNQVDWLPLEEGSVRPTQGRTLAVMQVSGGSQSFNAVNTLRLLGRLAQELAATGWLHNHTRMWFAFNMDLYAAPAVDAGRRFLPAPPCRRRPCQQHVVMALGGGPAHPRSRVRRPRGEHPALHRGPPLASWLEREPGTSGGGRHPGGMQAAARRKGSGRRRRVAAAP